MPPSHSSLARLLLALGGVAPLVAQTPPLTEEEAARQELLDVMNTPVTGASKREQKLLESPQALEVLTRDQIRAMGVFELPAALRTMTGVDIQSFATISAVVIRNQVPLGNAAAENVQVLVDGTPLYNPEIFPIYMNNLPVPMDAVERVEVVRGPSSTLYGANAQLGVVTLTTRRASEGLTGSLRAGAGEGGTARGQGFVAYGAGNFGLTAAVAGASLRDSGFDQRVIGSGRGDRQPDQNHGSQAFLRSQFAAGANTFWATFGRAESRGWPETLEDPATGLPLARIASQALTSQILQGGWKRAWSPALQSEFRLQETRLSYAYGAWSPGTPGNPQATFIFNLLTSQDPRLLEGYAFQQATSRELTTQWNWNPSGTTHFTFGADARKMTGEPSGIVGFQARQEATGAGAFLSAESRFGDLMVSAGLRAENETLGGSRTSPRLSLVYALGPDSVLRAGYFTSTRSPRMIQKSAQILIPTRAIIPNPDLKPEKAASFEVGYRKGFGHWALDATAYRMTLDHTIGLVPTGITVPLGPLNVPQSQFRNAGELINQGLELSLTGELRAGWTLGLNGTLVDQEDPTKGAQADYVPKLMANLWTRVKLRAWFAYLGLRHRSAYDARARVGPNEYVETLGAKLSVDAHLGLELGRGFSLSAYAFNAGRDHTYTKNNSLQNTANLHYERREAGIQGVWKF